MYAPQRHAVNGATSYASNFPRAGRKLRIKQYFVDQYGARVLAEPPRTGLNWLVYVLPPLVIVSGAILLVRAMQSWTKPVASDTSPNSEAQGPRDEYVARLEEELKRRT